MNVLKDGLSIIVPAYNEEKNLQASILSAADADKQAGLDYEIHFVNKRSRLQPA